MEQPQLQQPAPNGNLSGADYCEDSVNYCPCANKGAGTSVASWSRQILAAQLTVECPDRGRRCPSDRFFAMAR